jgi:hypothetical protein
MLVAVRVMKNSDGEQSVVKILEQTRDILRQSYSIENLRLCWPKGSLSQWVNNALKLLAAFTAIDNDTLSVLAECSRLVWAEVEDGSGASSALRGSDERVRPPFYSRGA